MFNSDSTFNQPLDTWNVSLVTDFTAFLTGVNLSTTYYDLLLISWSNLNLQDNIIFDAGYSLYSNLGLSPRNYIISNFNWFIRDGGSVDIIPPTDTITTTPIITSGSLTSIITPPSPAVSQSSSSTNASQPFKLDVTIAFELINLGLILSPGFVLFFIMLEYRKYKTTKNSADNSSFRQYLQNRLKKTKNHANRPAITQTDDILHELEEIIDENK